VLEQVEKTSSAGVAKRDLLLDVGNTSIKYAWYVYPNNIADLQILRCSLAGLPDLLTELKESAGRCYLGSVKDDEVNQNIAQLCKTAGVKHEQVQTQSKQFGVTNAYAQVSNMGVDRWLAIIGAGALTTNHFIVIDAGTAITCDFVVNEAHLGGWIAPGLRMARQSVVQNTQRVFDNQVLPGSLQAGTDTPDCVAQGALAQLTGMVNQAAQRMRMYIDEAFALKQQKDELSSSKKEETLPPNGQAKRYEKLLSHKFDVFMSGGDAPLLISAISTMQNNLAKQHHLFVNINYVENIVILGLARIAHDKASTNA
jgi:type III pantothenate kinase